MGYVGLKCSRQVSGPHVLLSWIRLPKEICVHFSESIKTCTVFCKVNQQTCETLHGLESGESLPCCSLRNCQNPLVSSSTLTQKRSMDAIVKKSLGAPVRQLSSCVSGVKDGMSRKGKGARRKSAPCCYSQTAHDSSWIRAYQAELHRERKLRQVMLSQKNAERTAVRNHYRSPHRYTKTSQNRKPMNAKAPSKNDDSLFGAFQGLSLNMGSTQASISAPPTAEQCKMM